MSTDPYKEHPSTYPIQDRGNLDEFARLDVQDSMLNSGMGGALPELDSPSHLQRVLDVGCGTGDWLLETARTFPTIEQLVGVDISSQMRAYAHEKAQAQHLDGRVQFQTMNALRGLEYPDSFFDLVNLRFGVSWIRTWEWTKLLTELLRVTREGGIIRLTECSVTCESTSPALSSLWDIMLETSYRSGRLFMRSSDGITRQLVPLLTQHDLKQVQTRTYSLSHHAGTQAGQHFFNDMRHVFHLLLPYFQQWTRVPDDYQQIYQQALQEMQEPHFVATWTLLTAFGFKR